MKAIQYRLWISFMHGISPSYTYVGNVRSGKAAENDRMVDCTFRVMFVLAAPAPATFKGVERHCRPRNDLLSSMQNPNISSLAPSSLLARRRRNDAVAEWCGVITFVHFSCIHFSSHTHTLYYNILLSISFPTEYLLTHHKDSAKLMLSGWI